MDDLAYVNQIILSELLPSARLKKENEFIDSMSGLELVPLDIDWLEIEEIQYNCLKSGINRLLKKHQVIRGNHFCRIISEIAA